MFGREAESLSNQDKGIDIGKSYPDILLVAIIIIGRLMTLLHFQTHLSSPRPKQSRKTAISSLPLFCWIVGRVFGHQRISLLEASPDYLRTRISADMV